MTLVRAMNLKPGDHIDLQGDPYGDNDMAEFEYAAVEGTEIETSACVRVDTDQTSFGCPLDHEIRMRED
jgi:hypothetical protein